MAFRKELDEMSDDERENGEGDDVVDIEGDDDMEKVAKMATPVDEEEDVETEETVSVDDGRGLDIEVEQEELREEETTSDGLVMKKRGLVKTTLKDAMKIKAVDREGNGNNAADDEEEEEEEVGEEENEGDRGNGSADGSSESTPENGGDELEVALKDVDEEEIEAITRSADPAEEDEEEVEREKAVVAARAVEHLIDQLGKNQLVGQAEELFKEMCDREIKPDEYTYVLLVESCFGVDPVDNAKMVESGLRPNITSYEIARLYEEKEREEELWQMQLDAEQHEE